MRAAGAGDQCGHRHDQRLPGRGIGVRDDDLHGRRPESRHLRLVREVDARRWLCGLPVVAGLLPALIDRGERRFDGGVVRQHDLRLVSGFEHRRLRGGQHGLRMQGDARIACRADL